MAICRRDCYCIRGKPTVTDESESRALKRKKDEWEKKERETEREECSVTEKREKGREREIGHATLTADMVITGEIGRGRALMTSFITETTGTIRQVDFRININNVFHSLT